ncbi:MAG: ribonuclease III [Deltaproteobacteria bacterium]|nr:ribonuclease III [Deltaproteobacteria bacterium]
MTDREQRRAELVRGLCERLGLPREPARMREALTHPSFANERPAGEREDNQRLEFLGDAVLGLCTSELLMARFPGATEGELTVMRASLVNATALAAFARRIELGSALRLGRGARAAGEHRRPSVLADALEAVLGAAYLELGMAEARRLAAQLLEPHLAELGDAGGAARDAKSQLQERVQGDGLPAPVYRLVGVAGPSHARRFSAVVEVDGSPLGSGEGPSKKLAEQAAARAALARLGAGD